MPIRDQQKVRRAAAAGRFYEGDALSLRRRMAETEAGLPPEAPSGKTVRGCVLPHAGYMFSLGVAMETLRAARHCGCSKVVLLGPSHYVGFRGIAAATFTSWRTPFGDLSTATTVNDDAHTNEHSLEVLFPLIQYFFDAPLVLPLVVGGISAEDAQSLGAALAKLDAPDVLWLISSDFTHYGRKFRYTPFGESADPAELNRLDREAAELIAARDLTGFVKFLGRTGATICGAHPIAIYLAMLDGLEPERTVRGRVAAMADSGAVSGDYRTVVDYAGIVFEKA